MRSITGVLILFLSINSWSQTQNNPLASWGALTGFIDQPVTAISAGTDFILALQADGIVKGWGDNHYGQLNVPYNLTNVKSIAAGYTHGLALKADGTVVAWGDNSGGETDVPINLKKVIGIAAGQSTSAALQEDGTVVVWGGDAVKDKLAVPIGLKNVKQIVVGAGHFAALKEDGTVVEWGINQMCTELTQMKDIKKISANANYTLALSNSGYVDNNCGIHYIGPKYIFSNITDIAMGQRFFLTLDNQGRIWQADGTNNPDIVSVGDKKVIAITAGGWHAAALLEDGTVKMFADYHNGQASLPQGFGRIKEIASGGNQAAVVFENGEAQVWGYLEGTSFPLTEKYTNVRKIFTSNFSSIVLKNDSTASYYSSRGLNQPFYVSSIDNVIDVALGPINSAFLLKDSTVVGVGMPYDQIEKVPVGLKSVRAIGMAYNFGVALKQDGTIEHWGWRAPDVPAGISNIKAIAVGWSHVLALKEDGTVIGYGDSTIKAAIVPKGLKDVKAIATSNYHSVALKTDGTIVVWGSPNPNGYECLNVPVGFSNVKSIAVGDGHIMVLLNDNTVVPLGMKDEVNYLSSTVTLFPNPSKGMLFIDDSRIVTGDVLSFYNVSGTKLKQINLTEKNTQIDISLFTNGLYFYELKRNEVVIGKGRIIRE